MYTKHSMSMRRNIEYSVFGKKNLISINLALTHYIPLITIHYMVTDFETFLGDIEKNG